MYCHVLIYVLYRPQNYTQVLVFQCFVDSRSIEMYFVASFLCELHDFCYNFIQNRSVVWAKSHNTTRSLLWSSCRIRNYIKLSIQNRLPTIILSIQAPCSNNEYCWKSDTYYLNKMPQPTRSWYQLSAAKQKLNEFWHNLDYVHKCIANLVLFFNWPCDYVSRLRFE